MCSFLSCFFFFKQKTAYEMRISDWSSDVCSSDLPANASASASALPCASAKARAKSGAGTKLRRSALGRVRIIAAALSATKPGASHDSREGSSRSEEHTSELQSLMRISYAVFCLKKKIHNTDKYKLQLQTSCKT